MTIDRRLLAGVLGTALLVAACGGSSTASPGSSAAASTGASQNSEPSAAPSDQVPSAAPSNGGPDVSFVPGAASDLEGMLPSTVGTLTFTKTSFDGAQIANAGSLFDASTLDPVLSKYGKTIADVRMAIAQAVPSTATPGDFGVAIAIQLRGVPASQFVPDMETSQLADSTKQNIGGKDVYVKTDSGITTMYYFKDDIAFLITASTANANAILGQLP